MPCCSLGQGGFLSIHCIPSCTVSPDGPTAGGDLPAGERVPTHVLLHGDLHPDAAT